MSFSDNLKKILLLKGISQSELARRTGINKAIISEYVSGKYEPKQQNTFKIATALEVKPSDLMGIYIDDGVEKEEPVILNDHDKNMVEAYHRASDDDKQIVDITLKKYLPQNARPQIEDVS